VVAAVGFNCSSSFQVNKSLVMLIIAIKSNNGIAANRCALRYQRMDLAKD
jgi:hypothetical protein